MNIYSVFFVASTSLDSEYATVTNEPLRDFPVLRLEERVDVNWMRRSLGAFIQHE